MKIGQYSEYSAVIASDVYAYIHLIRFHSLRFYKEQYIEKSHFTLTAPGLFLSVQNVFTVIGR